MKQLLPESNPVFFHTKCYSKIGRALYRFIVKLGLTSRYNLRANQIGFFTLDGKLINADKDCFCFLHDRPPFRVARAMNNEILLRRMGSVYDDAPASWRSFVMEKETLHIDIGRLIGECCKFIKDEDQPFLILPDGWLYKGILTDYLKSDNSFYESTNLEKIATTGEFFTIRKLKEINAGSTDGIIDQFVLEAKTQLRDLLFKKIGEVERFMYDNIVKFYPDPNVVYWVTAILNSRDDVPIEWLITHSDFNSLSDIYREKLVYWKIEKSAQPTFLTAIVQLERQKIYRELVEIMTELNRLTPVKEILNDYYVFLE